MYMKINPIIVKEITQDILDWLEDRCADGYSIQPRMVCFLWAGPLINLPNDQKYTLQKDGHEIWFKDKKVAVEFKINFDI